MIFALPFELGYYDLASQIDKVLSETKQQKLNYVGFSQGKSVNHPNFFAISKLNFLFVSRHDAVLYFKFNATRI